MIFNTLMEPYLANISWDDISICLGWEIWQDNNEAGLPYWGTGDFCGCNKTAVKRDHNLTHLEWDGNEVYISEPTDIFKMLLRGLGIISAWKEQMKRDYAETPFDIFLSIDEGDEEVPPSVTLRFWAVRDGEHFILPSVAALEQFCQPVLMVQANYGLPSEF